MNRVVFFLLIAIFATGCGRQGAPQPAKETPAAVAQPGAVPQAKAATLADARRAHATKFASNDGEKTPLPAPPAKLFRIVKFDSAVGKLSAYLTPDPKNGKKNPAIIWITGGDCNSIDEGCWNDGPPSNDQSAGQYRKAGIVQMFPSLRGGNDNPGSKEAFYGEVNDVVSALDFLAKQDFVDPTRIYLGGHSTGGTLVLLVAESTDRFRAVFSFGPADDVRGYPAEYFPFDKNDLKEVNLRSPGRWLESVKGPTFVIEGMTQGNIASLNTMASSTKNPNLHFLKVRGGDHFSILAPINRLIATKILSDTGPTCSLTFTEQELSKTLGR